MRRAHTLFVLVALLAACSRAANQSQPSTLPSELALQAQPAAPGHDTRVSLHAASTAGPIVTLVGELNYDTQRLAMKSCAIDEKTSAGKALHVAEPVPGTVRAVLAGTLDPLPPAAELLVCTFAVAADAPDGPTTVRAHGEVADTTFEDRPFTTEQIVQIGN